MNLLDLTPSQLKRAAAIKEQVERLDKELHGILGVSGVSANSASASTKNRTMSAAVRKKIAATQKTRWARRRRAKSTARSARPAVRAKKKAMSPAARAKLSAKLKAYWAAKKSGKK
jgi:hypothetical protein